MTNPAIFFILAESTNGGETWEDNFEWRFESGAEAQAEAKRKNDACKNDIWASNIRYRVRKVVDTDADNFVARESNKDRQWVDWSKLPYYANNPYYYFAHFHPEDKTKIRFYPSVIHAVENKWLVVRAPRFFTNYAEISADECEDYLVEVGYYSGKAEFKILTHEDEIVHAYQNGPTSCMNDPDEYPLPTPHPASVYASPDLALAVMDRGGEEGISARAVVSPVRKIYGRVYGHASLLEQHLKAAGYRKTRGWSAWRGLRLNAVKIEDDWGKEKYLCPYLDMSGTVSLSRDKKFLRIAGYDKGTMWSQGCQGWASPRY